MAHSLSRPWWVGGGRAAGAVLAALLAVIVPSGNAQCPASCQCQDGFTVVSCIQAGLEVRKTRVLPTFYYADPDSFFHCDRYDQMWIH